MCKLSAVDRDIRREVAVKYLLDESRSTNKLRFVEEAQITGPVPTGRPLPIADGGEPIRGVIA